MYVFALVFQKRRLDREKMARGKTVRRKSELRRPSQKKVEQVRCELKRHRRRSAYSTLCAASVYFGSVFTAVS